nr:hypothetical protein [Natronorubrum halophilum]
MSEEDDIFCGGVDRLERLGSRFYDTSGHSFVGFVRRWNFNLFKNFEFVAIDSNRISKGSTDVYPDSNWFHADTVYR